MPPLPRLAKSRAPGLLQHALCDAPVDAERHLGAESNQRICNKMMVRRLINDVDLRDLPLDAYDMFLLARIASATMDVDEVVALTPCDPAEARRRIDYLVRLGVLEALGQPGEEHGDSRSLFDDEVTRERPQLRREDPSPLERAILARVSAGSK